MMQKALHGLVNGLKTNHVYLFMFRPMNIQHKAMNHVCASIISYYILWGFMAVGLFVHLLWIFGNGLCISYLYAQIWFEV